MFRRSISLLMLASQASLSLTASAESAQATADRIEQARRARIRQQLQFAVPELQKMTQQLHLKTGAGGDADAATLKEMEELKVVVDNPQKNEAYYKLYSAFSAQPGSPARKAAAEILKAELEKAYEQVPAGATPEAKADQKLTRDIFTMSLKFLAGKTCRPDEKIRVYRGVGTQPIVRRPGTLRGWQAPNGVMQQIFKALVINGVSNDKMKPTLRFDGINVGQDSGEMAFRMLKDITLNYMFPLPWPMLLGVGRKAGGDVAINGQFSYLASAHTGTSNGSPLMSVTIDPTQAQSYGPVTLVLDVCPERLMPSRQDLGYRFMNEAEFYLPMFILPEEITRMVGTKCVQARKPGDPRPDGCGSEVTEDGNVLSSTPYVFEDKDPVNPITQTYRKAFANSGHPFEAYFQSSIVYQLDGYSWGGAAGSPSAKLDAYYDNKVKKFYQMLGAASGDVEYVRTKLIPQVPFKTECSYSAELIKLTREVVLKLRDKVRYQVDWQSNSKIAIKKTVSEYQADLKNAAEMRKKVAAYKQYLANDKKICPNLKLGAGW